MDGRVMPIGVCSFPAGSGSFGIVARGLVLTCVPILQAI